jgi:AcrR family transcriptional regulator
VAAATELLKTAGFAGATTRAIAASAECNVGLISYYFGGLNNLLLEALDSSAAGRLERYRVALAGATTLKQLRRRAREQYREDCETGHTALLAQMVVGGLMDRTLGAQVALRVQPWLELSEAALHRAIPTAALRRALPVAEMAYATVALFLGLEILGNLSGDHGRGRDVVARLMSDRMFSRPVTAP